MTTKPVPALEGSGSGESTSVKVSLIEPASSEELNALKTLFESGTNVMTTGETLKSYLKKEIGDFSCELERPFKSGKVYGVEFINIKKRPFTE